MSDNTMITLVLTGVLILIALAISTMGNAEGKENLPKYEIVQPQDNVTCVMVVRSVGVAVDCWKY